MTSTNSEAKPFDLADVLTIITGRMLSERTRMQTIVDFLNFMTNLQLDDSQVEQAAAECVVHLAKQHPSLGSPEMLAAIAELEAIASEDDLTDTELGRRVSTWLTQQKTRCGETLMIAPIPENERRIKAPTHGTIVVNLG